MDCIFCQIAAGKIPSDIVYQDEELVAFRDGWRDAREGQPPYFWALFTEPEHRRDMLRSGWKSIGKVFIIAIVLDLVFQYIVFHNLSWRGGALIAGVILALVPYLLIRGPVNRVASRKGKKEKHR